MGARFSYCQNNGVAALMSFAWYRRIYDHEHFGQSTHQDAIDWDGALKEGLRIFTFCSARRLMRNPREMRYFTGIHEDMQSLLENLGLENSGILPNTFYVPFSNGWGVMRQEHKFAVSFGDILQHFGEGAETAVL